MAASLVAATLTTNTVVQALFDSLIERLLNRVSHEIPVVIENSIKKYAIDNINNNNNNNGNDINHHVLLLNESVNKTKNKNKNKNNDDIYFCNSVLKLVDERLKTLDILTMSDLNVSLSHLSDAKHALYMNNIKRFRYFIEESYLKAREALFKITNLFNKIYVYAILLFDGFMIFSDFGNNLRDGLAFIKKLLSEIQSDQQLNNTLNQSLNSWRWNTFDKTLIGHSILFSTKISSLIRAITNRINHSKYTQNIHYDKDTKNLKSLFYEIQDNMIIIHDDNDDNDDKKEENENNNDNIMDINEWIPNLWNGYFFGVNDKYQNIIIDAKHYLNLFKLNDNNGNIHNLWFSESTNLIYQYSIDNKMWLNVSDSLLFDYYYHKKLNQLDKINKLNKKFNIKAFNDHFNKYMIENRLIIRKNWISIHPKLKLLLKDYLTHNNISLYGNIKNISTLDLSFNDKLFGLNGIKYVSSTINIKKSSIKTLKIAKNDLNFKCIQLFVISLLSIPTNHYSSLIELNISYNIEIEDNSIYLLLNKGIAQKCPNLQNLYIQWTSISNLSAKYIVSFYEIHPYHSLTNLYLNGNKHITSEGCIVLNAALQGIMINRKDIIINISDCQINVASTIKFDKRLIVNN